jgi:hypothetical protein
MYLLKFCCTAFSAMAWVLCVLFSFAYSCLCSVYICILLVCVLSRYNSISGWLYCCALSVCRLSCHRSSLSFISVYLHLQLFYKMNPTILIFHCAIYLSIISTFSTSQLTTCMSFISFVSVIL